MDAKPQRPMRTVRVRTDENIPPATQNAKVIHHRNKSSPALSTMLGAGGIKAAAKRTAFGDVSNTANVPRASKDDSAIAAKHALQVVGKPALVIAEKKPATLQRPAQRPMSVSNLRALVNGVTGHGSVDASSQPPTVGPAATGALANTRKVLTKRNTTIFRDISVSTGADPSTHPITQAPTSTLLGLPQIIAKPIPSLPPLTEEVVVTKDRVKTSTDDKPESTLPPARDSTLEASSVSSEQSAANEIRSDGIYIDEKGYYRLYEEPAPVEQKDPARSLKASAPATTEATRPQPSEMPTAAIPLPPQTFHLNTSVHSQTVACSEPEEYWEEEDDENYDEDGYVTARSYRSGGGNTTGGATTILFPHVNQRIKKELAAAKALVESTRTPEEIEDECYDTSMVAEYGDEIFDYMKRLEVKMLPNAHYMDNQHEIQWSMRAVLMDWLVQVHHRFNLLPETLFLCVNYIDRFLSCKVVSLGKLQLVGATAIFIAAKYEEINCPSVQEIVYMVDGGYTIDEILKAERFMLSMLQFELGWPGPMSFLRRISKADDYDLETRTLAKYFLEVTLMDERFIGSPPSFAAAGSHCLARMMLRKGEWTPQHVYYSDYTFSQLSPLLNLILECCENPNKHHAAVYNKYCDKRYKRASAFVESELQRGFTLTGLPTPRESVAPPLSSHFDPFHYFGWEG